MRWLGVGLVLSLVASLGVFGASSASAQTGPMAQVWTRKLPSDNVEFGLSVTSAGSRTNVSLTNRYFLYGASSTGTWYYSDWQVIGDNPYNIYARVQARKLLSGNVEFGLQIGGLGFEADSKSRVWVPRARYLTYQAASTNSVLYSSGFNVRSHAHECLNGTVFSSPNASKIGLAHDCAALLEARDILQGTSTAFSNWNASTPIANWTGISLLDGNSRVIDRVTSLSHGTYDTRASTVSGRIPPHLGVLSELVTLDLSGNSLTGEIPEELGNLTKLVFLYLDANQLTGSIPTQLGDIQGGRSSPTEGFTELYLSENNLTGGIPTELGNLIEMQALFLNDNNLTGSIPSSIGQIAHLLDADFSGNSLSGCVPAALDRGGTTVERGGLSWCTS